jgi:hypothetical protein
MFIIVLGACLGTATPIFWLAGTPTSTKKKALTGSLCNGDAAQWGFADHASFGIIDHLFVALEGR